MRSRFGRARRALGVCAATVVVLPLAHCGSDAAKPGTGSPGGTIASPGGTISPTCGSPGDTFRIAYSTSLGCRDNSGKMYFATGLDERTDVVTMTMKEGAGGTEFVGQVPAGLADGEYDVAASCIKDSVTSVFSAGHRFTIPCPRDAGPSDGAAVADSGEPPVDSGGTPADVGGIVTVRVNLTAGGASVFGFLEAFGPPADATAAAAQRAAAREVAFSFVGSEVPVGTCATGGATPTAPATSGALDFGASLALKAGADALVTLPKAGTAYQGSGSTTVAVLGKTLSWASSDATSAAAANGGTIPDDPKNVVTAPDFNAAWSFPNAVDHTIRWTARANGLLVVRFGGGGSPIFCVADAKQSSFTIPAATVTALPVSGQADFRFVSDVTAAPTGSVASRPLRHLIETNRGMSFAKQ